MSADETTIKAVFFAALEKASPAERAAYLDEALSRLAGKDPMAAQVVQLHFFAGLPIEHVAEALGVSRATAYRQWAYARAWLRSAMGQGEDEAPP